jgi:hypothetical protein
LKKTRIKKVLGVVLGEKSLLTAEVAIVDDAPQVKRLAEMVYPEGITLAQPVELAKAMGHFLKDNEFGSRQAVVGIPLKWIVVKPKEVPPTDDATVAQLLRLEAEQEFSTELKDLVYDFASEAQNGEAAANRGNRSVLLAATPKKYIDAIEAFCEGARLKLMSIMPSALALGRVTGESVKRDVMVLSVGSAGSELSSHRQAAATAIRSLRPATPQPAFMNELRRAVSTLASPSGDREMVLWDGAGLNADNLGKQLGLTVTTGELRSLGVDTSQAGINGQGAKFAAAVALALAGMSEAGPAIDFLHSRLAPPKQHRIPRWAYMAAGAALLLIVGGIMCYSDLSDEEQKVADLNAQINTQQKQVDAATDFVSKAKLAQYWHAGDPRYLLCWRDLENVIPDDHETYAISVEIKAQTPSLDLDKNAPGATPATPGQAAATDDKRSLFVTLQGHTLNMVNVTALVERMHKNPDQFRNVQIGSGQKVPRSNEWLFTIQYDYVPPKIELATASGAATSTAAASGTAPVSAGTSGTTATTR